MTAPSETNLQCLDAIPDCADLASEADRLLRCHLSEVRDYTTAFHRRAAEKGIIAIDGVGWAIRPMFLPASRMAFIAAAFRGAMEHLRQEILRNLGQPAALARLLPFGRGIETTLQFAAALGPEQFHSHFRPDGFLFPDRYELSEINYGNGILVSTAYTEATYAYWAEHPILKRMGLDIARLHPRPLMHYMSAMRRAARPVNRPAVALVIHSAEMETIRGFPERVIRQFEYAVRIFRQSGFSCRLVDETGIDINRRGCPVFRTDGTSIDLVQFVSVGTSFMDRPELLKKGGPLEHFAGGWIGDVRILKPLAGLLVDKGALPLLCETMPDRVLPDGSSFAIAWSQYPCRTLPGLYEEDRSGWVIKRAFDGKDTHPGIARSDEDWRRIVARAARDAGYIAQRYVAMPRARIPVLLDGQHLEWIDSRAEASMFIFDGKCGGVGIRHAPAGDGLVLTDFPEGYGYTTACLV